MLVVLIADVGFGAELKMGDDDHGHLLDPEEHINLLMARQ